MKALIILLLVSCAANYTDSPHFYVIIPTYRNAAYCIQNISTLVEQNYSDWEAHIIIDGKAEEDDGTRQLLSTYITEHRLEDKITIHCPNERRLALYNIYYAAHLAQDPEAVLVLYDGDDYFTTPNALQRIAQEYADPNVWMTYGQYTNVPAGTPGHCHPFPETVNNTNGYRNYTWIASHVRTYKVWLFQSVALIDFLHNGKFYPLGWDVAFLPMLEMSGAEHMRFIPDEMYAYRHHERNDYVINYALLKKCEKTIRERKPYRKLKHSRSDFFRKLVAAKADLIIYSKDRPLQLYALLESVERSTSNLDNKVVIYHVSNSHYGQAYEQLKHSFPRIQFIEQSRKNPRADFKQITLQTLNNFTNKYVIFAVDDIIIKDTIDFTQAIQSLEKTKSYAVFMRLGKNTDYCYSLNMKQGIPDLVETNPNVYAWQFSRGQADWSYPNNVDMTLYRRKNVIRALSKLSFSAPNSLEAGWATGAHSVMQYIGLCYGLSKIVNIPANLVQHELNNRHMENYSPEYLLEIFNKGLKIDISRYWNISNNAAHTPLELHFIPRI